MTLYEANMEFEELIDAAINDLSPMQFRMFLDNVYFKIEELEEDTEE